MGKSPKLPEDSFETVGFLGAPLSVGKGTSTSLGVQIITGMPQKVILDNTDRLID